MKKQRVYRLEMGPIENYCGEIEGFFKIVGSAELVPLLYSVTEGSDDPAIAITVCGIHTRIFEGDVLQYEKGVFSVFDTEGKIKFSVDPRQAGGGL